MGGNETLSFADPSQIDLNNGSYLDGKKKEGYYEVSRVSVVAYVLLSLALAAVVGVVVHFTSPCGTCLCPPAVCPTAATTEIPSEEAFWARCVEMSWERNECLPGTPPCSSTPETTEEPSTTSTQPPTEDRPENYLLPTNLVPSHYDVELRPDMYSEDSANFSFSGHSVMHFECVEATDKIVMHYRLLTFDNSTITVQDESGTSVEVVGMNTLSGPYDFFSIYLGANLTQGTNYTVGVNFTGPLKRDMAGMYWSSYVEGDHMSYLVATQFEAPDARKAFPCMDEPRLKATFNISMWHKSGFSALSNMPDYAVVQGDDDWVLTKFDRTSVVMPTYLVAFAVANYSYLESNTEGGLGTPKPSKYWARHEYIADGYADYVMENFTDIVFDYLESYFNHPYLLPKQDQIAIPDFAAGAMENWGLITYREERLLWDPQMSTEYEKQRASGTIAHEFLHMWLGNVVTCKWWSGIWLQEGMARHHQHLAVQEAQPTWDLDQIFIAQVLWRAFSVDQLGDAHPIHNPTISTYRNPGSVFTAITYDKAGSFIRMMSDVVMGRDSYEAAMQEYVDKMQYGSAVYDDLFQSWDDQANADNIGVNMTEVGLTWIMQTGHPVIKLSRNVGSNGVTAEQQIFLIESGRPLDEWYESPFGYAWEIPLTFITSKNQTVQTTWLHRENRTINVGHDIDSNDWILANGNQRGLYRVNYDTAGWDVLIDQLDTDHTVFDEISRAALVHDSLDLARAGHADPVTALRLTRFLSSDPSYLAWYGFDLGLQYYHYRMFRSGDYQNLRLYVADLTNATYFDLGWIENESDDLFTVYLRTLVLRLACQHGHEHCVLHASNIFNEWRNNPDDLFNIIHPNVREAVYCTAIAMGTSESWDFLHNQYFQSFTHFSLERQRRRDGLACSRETWILQRYLDMAVSGNALIHPSDRTSIMQRVVRNPVGHGVAWDYLNTHWHNVSASYRRTLLTTFGQTSSSQMDLEKIENLIEVHPPESESESEYFESLLFTVKTNIAWSMAHIDDVSDWLLKEVMSY